MGITIKETSLYRYIGREFEQRGWRYIIQPSVSGREPDLILEREGIKVVTEVKIDMERKLTEAIADAMAKAFLLKMHYGIALLFPREIRYVSPELIEKVCPETEVTAIILTDWWTGRIQLPLRKLADLFTRYYNEWIASQKLTRKISFDDIVECARISIRDIASRLKWLIFAQKDVLDVALALVGRFDIYRNLIEDYSGASEDEIKSYIADITAYILINQLLFYHKISEDLGLPPLPNINPLNPPSDLLLQIENLFRLVKKKYPRIFGFDSIRLLIAAKDIQILHAVARAISAIKGLRSQYISEDLYGRLYQETIPPETRKNLGAFYTNPIAAEILATLAIDKWDAKVIDPACGSGTLLVKAYQRKLELAPPYYDREKLHEEFVKKHIWGMDIMQFAVSLASINLASQYIKSPVEPSIYPCESIKTMMMSALADDPCSETSLERWLEMEKLLPVGYFNVCIMNPPFTRRENMRRMLGNKGMRKLQRMVPEVRGRTGYWAYFVVASEKILTPDDATLALVIPEGFFAGKGAVSVRHYLIDKGYKIQFVVRNAAQIAFSEGTHYRDYLVVLRKGEGVPDTLTIVILKRRLEEMADKAKEIALKALKFHQDPSSKDHVESEFEMFKMHNATNFVQMHIENLRPLVGFNTIKGARLALELLEALSGLPTLGEIFKGQIYEYVPGQYKEKADVSLTKKLFISRYGARTGNVVLLLDKVAKGTVYVKDRRGRIRLSLPTSAVVRSLRSCSKVKHMNLTDEEEYAIIDVNHIPRGALNQLGLLPLVEVKKAARDIKEAHDDKAANLLLARRVQLDSPNIYWLAFYSDNKMIGTDTFFNIQEITNEYGKILTVYLNSSIVLLQLLAFLTEVRATWVNLHGGHVWGQVHVFEPDDLNKSVVNKAVSLFNKIGKTDVNSLFQRIKQHDKVQREIDELSLDMIGMGNWKGRLDEIYNVIFKELEIMRGILKQR